MIIIMTCTVNELLAGVVYDIPTDKAQAFIANEQAIAAEDVEIKEPVKKPRRKKDGDE